MTGETILEIGVVAVGEKAVGAGVMSTVSSYAYSALYSAGKVLITTPTPVNLAIVAGATLLYKNADDRHKESMADKETKKAKYTADKEHKEYMADKKNNHTESVLDKLLNATLNCTDGYYKAIISKTKNGEAELYCREALGLKEKSEIIESLAAKACKNFNSYEIELNNDNLIYHCIGGFYNSPSPISVE
jgi:hypothetical protein